MRTSYLHRGLAIFFLLFVCTDLNCPQACCEELGKLPQERAAAVAASTRAAEKSHAATTAALTGRAFLAEDPQQHQPVDSDSQDEDCLSCGHVLPGTSVFPAAPLELVSPSIVPHTPGLLSPPLESAFHPPRFI
jgi:hypothetical protein